MEPMGKTIDIPWIQMRLCAAWDYCLCLTGPNASEIETLRKGGESRRYVRMVYTKYENENGR